MRFTFVCVCLISISIVASAQNRHSDAKKKRDSIGVVMLKGTGKTAVIVVGSAAKATWWTTKFAMSQVAKPILLKAAPSVAKFALKTSVKYLMPLAVKLSIL